MFFVLDAFQFCVKGLEISIKTWYPHFCFGLLVKCCCYNFPPRKSSVPNYITYWTIIEVVLYPHHEMKYSIGRHKMRIILVFVFLKAVTWGFRTQDLYNHAIYKWYFGKLSFKNFTTTSSFIRGEWYFDKWPTTFFFWRDAHETEHTGHFKRSPLLQSLLEEDTELSEDCAPRMKTVDFRKYSSSTALNKSLLMWAVKRCGVWTATIWLKSAWIEFSLKECHDQFNNILEIINQWCVWGNMLTYMQEQIGYTHPYGIHDLVPKLQASARFVPRFPPVWAALGKTTMPSPSFWMTWSMDKMHNEWWTL